MRDVHGKRLELAHKKFGFLKLPRTCANSCWFEHHFEVIQWCLARWEKPLSLPNRLLLPVRCRAHHHENALPVFLKADVEVNPVDPDVHVPLVRQVPAIPVLVLGFPDLLGDMTRCCG